MANQWKIGDHIAGKYEIRRILGGREGYGGIRSGMGIVYVVYDHTLGMVWAIKTFQDQFLSSDKTKEAFRQEALTWVNLKAHPYIVQAHWAEQISGRLFISMEYIARDEEGRNCLRHYLTGQPLPLEQVLRWAIQFCYGIEYFYSKGVLCHRDIKPDNIMISFDGTVKITDFGLAGAFESDVENEDEEILKGGKEVPKGLSLIRAEKGFICGTPGYIAPEVLGGKGADQLADIFSFGVVLYQMASGFYESPLLQFWPKPKAVEKIPKLNTKLWPIIKGCLEMGPNNRCMNFGQLRSELETLLVKYAGATVTVPMKGELGPYGLANIGNSFIDLNLPEKAITYFDQALNLNPNLASIWSNKGRVLADLGRYDESMSCYDQAILIGTDEAAPAWNNKGHLLTELNRPLDALECFERALAINPRSSLAWLNKGWALELLGEYDEAIICYNEALKIDPKLALAWNNKANVFYKLLRPQEALTCCNKALEINPELAIAWDNKGNALWMLKRMEEAIINYDRALELNPRLTHAYINKSLALMSLNRHEEAIACNENALKLDSNSANAWTNKGVSLICLGHIKDALNCFEKAKELGQPNAIENIKMCRQLLEQ